MNYIISPTAVYLFNVLDKLSVLFIIAIIMSVFALAFSVLSLCANTGYTDDKSKREVSVSIKVIKISLIVLCASLFIYAVLPNKDVLLEMLLAKNITYDTLNIGLQKVKEFVIDIVTTIKQ